MSNNGFSSTHPSNPPDNSIDNASVTGLPNTEQDEYIVPDVADEEHMRIREWLAEQERIEGMAPDFRDEELMRMREQIAELRRDVRAQRMITIYAWVSKTTMTWHGRRRELSKQLIEIGLNKPVWKTPPEANVRIGRNKCLLFTTELMSYKLY